MRNSRHVEGGAGGGPCSVVTRPRWVLILCLILPRSRPAFAPSLLSRAWRGGDSDASSWSSAPARRGPRGSLLSNLSPPCLVNLFTWQPVSRSSSGLSSVFRMTSAFRFPACAGRFETLNLFLHVGLPAQTALFKM